MEDDRDDRTGAFASTKLINEVKRNEASFLRSRATKIFIVFTVSIAVAATVYFIMKKNKTASKP
jgi:hypothetical protein